MAAARRRGDAHRRGLTSPIDPPRSRSPRRRSRESATTRPGSAPRRSSRSFPTTRPWSGCAAACARTMPRCSASTRSPAPSTATRLTVPARATTFGRRCWRRRSPNAGDSRPRTSSRRPAPSRASSGGRVMVQASRRTGPMRHSMRRSGSTGETSTARACALQARGRLATTCKWRASGARYSVDTPLRATYYGISADGGGGRVSYAWDSATIASATVRRWWFTDGNDRTEASGFLTTRVVERPDLTIELRPELWWGANTRLDAPYFNPHRSTLRRPERGRAAPALAVVPAKPAPGAPAHGGRDRQETSPPWTGRPLQSTSFSSRRPGPGLRRRLRAPRERREPGRGPPRVDQPRASLP